MTASDARQHVSTLRTVKVSFRDASFVYGSILRVTASRFLFLERGEDHRPRWILNEHVSSIAEVRP